jgi:L-ascorbate metabolism protein UlaG (beta-lactamase superfamily)
VEEVEPKDRLSIDRVHFAVVEAVHSGRREPFGPEGQAIGCVIEGSRTVYFAGDTDLFPGMGVLAGRLDVALLPVWGWGPSVGEGHLDPQRAAEAVALIGPKLAIPIHWGTFALPWARDGGSDRPAREFAKLAAELAPEVEVRVLAPGESAELRPPG